MEVNTRHFAVKNNFFSADRYRGRCRLLVLIFTAIQENKFPDILSKSESWCCWLSIIDNLIGLRMKITGVNTNDTQILTNLTYLY